MPTPTKYWSTLIAITATALWACSTPKDDELPVEEPTAEAEAAVELSDLLPEQTWLVAGYDLAGYGDLHHHSAVPREVLSLLSPQAPVFDFLLSEALPAGLDGEKSLFVAVSREGLDQTLSKLRDGNPLLLDQLSAELPGALHVRVVAPAKDTAELEQSVEEHCTDNCPELLAMDSAGDYLLLDLAWRIDSGFGAADDVEFSGQSGFEVDATPAWKSFSEGDAPVRLYARTGDVFDQLAIFQLVERLQIAAGPDEEFGAADLLAIAQEVAFDDPATAESRDIALSLHRQDSIVFLDALATLTDYGQTVVDVLATGAPMKERTRQDAAFEMQWGFDLTNAIAHTGRPHWVGRVQGIDGAEEDFERLSQGMARDSQWGLPVSVFRSPVTSYALFDEFFGQETTPSEFAMVRGFWMQIFDVAGDEFVTAMGLHLPTDAPLDAFGEFAKAALLPFGSSPNMRSVEIGDGQEYQASTAVDVADIFGDEEITVDAEVLARADLRRIAAMIQQVDDAFGVAGPEAMILNFVANMGAPQLHFYTGFADGQAMSRLQWGGDELVRPEPVENKIGAQALEAHPQCLVQARQWSLLGLAQLAELESDDADARAKLGAQMSAHLSELAARCEGDATVQRLASDWAALGVR